MSDDLFKLGYEEFIKLKHAIVEELTGVFDRLDSDIRTVDVKFDSLSMLVEATLRPLKENYYTKIEAKELIERQLSGLYQKLKDSVDQPLEREHIVEIIQEKLIDLFNERHNKEWLDQHFEEHFKLVALEYDYTKTVAYTKLIKRLLVGLFCLTVSGIGTYTFTLIKMVGAYDSAINRIGILETHKIVTDLLHTKYTDQGTQLAALEIKLKDVLDELKELEDFDIELENDFDEFGEAQQQYATDLKELTKEIAYLRRMVTILKIKQGI